MQHNQTQMQLIHDFSKLSEGSTLPDHVDLSLLLTNRNTGEEFELRFAATNPGTLHSVRSKIVSILQEEGGKLSFQEILKQLQN